MQIVVHKTHELRIVTGFVLWIISRQIVRPKSNINPRNQDAFVCLFSKRTDLIFVPKFYKASSPRNAIQHIHNSYPPKQSSDTILNETECGHCSQSLDVMKANTLSMKRKYRLYKEQNHNNGKLRQLIWRIVSPFID